MDNHYNAASDDDEEEDLTSHVANNRPDSGRPPTSPTPPFAPSTYQNGAVDHSSSKDTARNSNEAHIPTHHRPGSSPLDHPPPNDTANLQSLPQPIYTDVGRGTMYPSTPSDLPSTLSPRFASTPQSQQRSSLTSYTPLDRSLPSRDLTDDTIDDAFVSFIFYCNPSVPLATDSAELRRGFRAPPRSDGKTFSTFTLLELIRKLESKEIKTWTQLAIQLGVEPPSAEKGQSTQKVQQYAVRLKRWMRAMHIDAFFEFCLGKPHGYYTQVPPPEAPFPEFGRDGVPLEEDLALRALRPESRPKRGRRKTEDKDTDSERGTPVKRPQLDTSVATADMSSFNSAHSSLFRDSGLPSTAQTDDLDRYVNHLDPWTAASTITPGSINTAGSTQTSTPMTASGGAGGQHFRWRLNIREGNTPTTPNPNSAMTPASAFPPDSAVDDLDSALTPSSASSRSRARRRHGPAVSSAWPSGGNPATGKLRGRPPSNRSVRDGPFSTFPANPKTREGPVIDLQGATPASTPISGHEDSRGPSHRFPFSPRESSPLQQQVVSKPGALHLQVPQHLGGPVHVATPTVVVNGGSEQSTPPPVDTTDNLDSGHREGSPGSVGGQQPRSTPDYKLVDVIRILAGKLMVAAVMGGDPTFDYNLGKKVAAQALEDIRATSSPSATGDDFLAECVTWFGLGGDFGCLPTLKTSMKDLRIHTSRESISSSGSSAVTYLVSWTLHAGPLVGDMTLLVSLPYDEPKDVGHSESSDPIEQATSWKKRYLAVQKVRNEEVVRMRRKVLEAVL
ncbi:MAG: hypothetical protein M1833_000218 [Piccolia ochrophora]|nr:MAG: hypothetical protein M1833_000218 [Piccolia ochrophora]